LTDIIGILSVRVLTHVDNPTDRVKFPASLVIARTESDEAIQNLVRRWIAALAFAMTARQYSFENQGECDGGRGRTNVADGSGREGLARNRAANAQAQ
jgi:hypothetical protein